VLARAADVIWDADNLNARALFKRAWEEADKGDSDDVTIKTKDNPPPMVTAMRRMSGRDLRAEVLAMMAKRDRVLSEEFLAKLKTEIDSSKEKTAPLPKDDWFVLEAVSKRIQVATELLKDGQTDKALENFQAAVADPRFELESRQGLGACFYRKGLFPLAARQFESALAAAGGVASEKGKEICYHLGLVSERMNDRSGALTRYLQIYEVDINYKDVSRKIEDLKPSD